MIKLKIHVILTQLYTKYCNIMARKLSHTSDIQKIVNICNCIWDTFYLKYGVRSNFVNISMTYHILSSLAQIAHLKRKAIYRYGLLQCLVGKAQTKQVTTFRTCPRLVLSLNPNSMAMLGLQI